MLKSSLKHGRVCFGMEKLGCDSVVMISPVVLHLIQLRSGIEAVDVCLVIIELRNRHEITLTRGNQIRYAESRPKQRLHLHDLRCSHHYLPY